MVTTFEDFERAYVSVADPAWIISEALNNGTYPPNPDGTLDFPRNITIEVTTSTVTQGFVTVNGINFITGRPDSEVLDLSSEYTLTGSKIFSSITDIVVSDLSGEDPGDSITVGKGGTVQLTVGNTTLNSVIVGEGGGFTPASIAGLTLWAKADAGAYTDAGTTLATNGQTVQQWNDQSGNNNNFSQGTAGFRPFFVTNVQNGLPALLFDGTDDFMNATIGADTSRTVFVVTEGLNVGFGTRFFGIGNNSQASVFDDTGIYSYYATQASGIGAIGGNSLNPAIIVLKVSSAASLTTYIDGVLGSTFDPANIVTTGTTITVGAGDSTGAFPDNCRIYEVVVYDTALSDANINLVDTYLGARWGITVASL